MVTSQSQFLKDADPDSRDALGFILRLGRALHTYGFPAHRIEDVLERATEKLGLHGQFFSTPTALFASFGPQEEQQTYLLRVTPGEVNLGKIADLDKAATAVLKGKLSPAEGSRQIEQIQVEPMPYNDFVKTLSCGVASAAASRFLGGGLKELVVSFVIGLMIGLLGIAAEKYHSLGQVAGLLAAFSASALSAVLSFTIGPFAASIATLAGLIVLMPGLTLTVAMVELSTQHLSSGTARLSRAFMILLGLGFGAAAGDSLIDSILGETQIARPIALPGWTEILALAMFPLALTVILRAHLRDAVWIVIAGALAIGGSKIGANILGPELGVFLGSLTVGIASSFYAHRFDRPAIITQVPGILLLVPGSVGFRGLAALLNEEVISGVETMFKMIITAVALVAGTLIASIVAPPRREI